MTDVTNQILCVPKAMLLAIVLALPVAARAGQQPNSTEAVTTHHEVAINGQSLNYTATAGFLPILNNDSAEAHGNMFFVSYVLDAPAGSHSRPVMFLWNGGPGSNSGLVHLIGFGPKRLSTVTGSTKRISSAGTALVENFDTWLAFSDLVFVDPIGTGYSRPTKAEYGSEFYQPRGDAESVAEFIRLFRTRFDLFDAPLFLAGESYGVTRCALVTDALERRGTRVAGTILLSGGFPLADDPAPSRGAFSLPTFTVAAYYHKKLPPDLQNGTVEQARRSAEVYAQGEYPDALAHSASLTEAQRDAVVAQVARFTGLPAAQIDRKTLRVDTEQFSNFLLASQNKMVGHYDSRAIGPCDSGPLYDPTKDPSLQNLLDPVAVIRYMRNELEFRSDIFYQGPFGGGYPPATTFRGDWMSTRWYREAPHPASPAPGAAPQGSRGESPARDAESEATGLLDAMNSDGNLRVFVASGYYDLAVGYLGVQHAVEHLSKEYRGRVTARNYPGGHALYTDDAVRHQLRIDVEEFVRSGR